MKRKKLGRYITASMLLIIPIMAYTLFKDDGSLSGFISEEAEIEYNNIYKKAMSYLPKPQQEMWIETEFGKVKAYRFSMPESEGKIPILLLPGKSAATPMWETNLLDLLHICPVYTLDLLGEPGLSKETKRIKTSEDQRQWLSQVLEYLPEDKLNILGLSFGGWSAVNLVIQKPVKVTSLILVDPVYVFETIPLKMILASIPASVPIIPKSIRESMLSYISGGAEAGDNVITAALIEAGMRNFKSKQPMPSLIAKEILEGINIPVLAILAGKSTMHHIEKSEERAKKYLQHPLSTVLTFPEASHAINGEYPKELAEAIENFYQKIEQNKRMESE